MAKGFLGTGAPFAADLNLTLQLLMGAALLAGFALARRGKYKAHGFCQGSVVVLNLALIVGIMLPHFHAPASHDPRRLVACVHGLLGLLAEGLGLYVVLVATQVMPAPLRFSSYKPWMRATLALWLTVIAFGVGTYALWYAPPLAAAATAAPAAPARAGETVVYVKEFEFVPKEVTVKAGTTVRWTGLAGMHSVVADDGSFMAGDAAVNAGRFEHRFDAPGDFPYSCEYHGDKRGKGMSGVVHVVP